MGTNFTKKTVNKSTIFFFIVFASLCFHGCGNREKKIEVPENKVEIDVRRFEQDLFQIDTNDFYNGIKALENKYGMFYDSWVNDIMGFNFDSIPERQILKFIKNNTIQELYGETQKHYKDFSPYQNELKEAFSRYNVLFPDKHIPEVVTFLSVFRYANPFYDSLLAVGLDMYLGKDYEYYSYPPMEFPAYKTRKMTGEYIVPNTVKALLNSTFEPDYQDKRFVNRIIFEGKILYMLDLLLPETPDSLKIGYSSIQNDWVKESEGMIWAYFTDQKLLFSTDMMGYSRFIEDGPFTSATGVPSDSAPMLGTWTGWQIVKKYMKDHPEITPKQLMDEKDPEKILRDSKYKPKK